MEENTILLLQDRHIEWGAQQFDDAFDFKELIKNPILGAIVEGADKVGGKITLNFINKRVSPYIPDEYKDEIHAALDDVIDGDDDYSEAVDNAISILDQLKDKLNVSDFVKNLIDALIELIKAALNVAIEKLQN